MLRSLLVVAALMFVAPAFADDAVPMDAAPATEEAAPAPVDAAPAAPADESAAPAAEEPAAPAEEVQQ